MLAFLLSMCYDMGKKLKSKIMEYFLPPGKHYGIGRYNSRWHFNQAVHLQSYFYNEYIDQYGNVVKVLVPKDWSITGSWSIKS